MASGVGHLPQEKRHPVSLADPRNRVYARRDPEIAAANLAEKATPEIRRIPLFSELRGLWVLRSSAFVVGESVPFFLRATRSLSQSSRAAVQQ